ncbi:MAG: SDR family NAD(P)-dependent oxidoreductase [Acidobacteriota bacterium]|nr:SDR family NAD(P)-dependent oxidoreductase [Acidobacteriota bacterium]
MSEQQGILHGRTAVITGGGRGIGAEVARSLAAAGAAVLVSARTESEIEALADELTQAGHRAYAATADVADEESVAALARAAAEHLGGVDILVNNAGIAASAPLARITLEDWNRIFAVNVTGTFLCTQAFLPAMVETGWGRIINVASVAGRSGGQYMAHYSSSKHAQVGFTRCAAAEVAGRGVTVNALCPGYVDTEMTRQSIERIVAKTRLDEEQALKNLQQTSGHGRLVTPQEVADAALWLCGDGAASVNGQAIVIDGGGFLG